MTRHQNKAPTSPLSSAGLSPGQPQVPADIPGGAGGTGGRRGRVRGLPPGEEREGDRDGVVRACAQTSSAEPGGL